MQYDIFVSEIIFSFSNPRCRGPSDTPQGKDCTLSQRGGGGNLPVALGTGGSADGALHLEKSSRVLCEGVGARYAMMKELRPRVPISAMCRVLAFLSVYMSQKCVVCAIKIDATVIGRNETGAEVEGIIPPASKISSGEQVRLK